MEITRRQGRVVLVGYVKLDIHPKNFLYHEIDLRYSRAYGPGSYHAGYEKGRRRLPVRVRALDREAQPGRVHPADGVRRRSAVEPLIAGVYPIDACPGGVRRHSRRHLAGRGRADLVRGEARSPAGPSKSAPRPKRQGKVGISLIGFGNHVLSKHLPNLQAMRDVELRGIASATGRNASVAAKSLGATIITTDVDELLADPGTDARDDLLESARALRAHPGRGRGREGCLRREAHGHAARGLRRAAPTDGRRDRRWSRSGSTAATRPWWKAASGADESMSTSSSTSCTQPFVPPDHWTLDPVDGGGRLVTEGEHFIDLCNLLIGRTPGLGHGPRPGPVPDDLRTLCNFSLTLHYDGAAATVVVQRERRPHFPAGASDGARPRPGRDPGRLRQAHRCTGQTSKARAAGLQQVDGARRGA